ATAVRPSRPTISMSQRPTNDSIENEKMTGHASAHVARRSSASGARAASATTARAIPSPIAAPSIAARVSRTANDGQRARLHDRARATLQHVRYVGPARRIGEDRLLEPARGQTRAHRQREEVDDLVGVRAEQMRTEDPFRAFL